MGGGHHFMKWFHKKSLFFRIDGFPNPEYKEDSGMTLLTSRLCVLSSSPELANFDSLICRLQIDLSGLEYKLKNTENQYTIDALG